MPPRKLRPWITTASPTAPRAGKKSVTTGIVPVTNAVALVAVPPGVVTVSGPVVAFAGTTTLNCVPCPVRVTLVAATPLNRTVSAPEKFAP